MNRLLSILVACVAVTLADTPHAQAQYAGYGTAGGYTYSNGYYYNNQGLAFKRVRTPYSYYSGGCLRTAYRWEYQPVEIDPYADSATNKLLEIAKARDAIEGRLRVESNKHNMFLEKLKALGMEGNFKWNGYGYQLQMATGAGFGNQVYQPYAQQGNTVYGYSSFATPYGNVDMTLAMKQAKDLVANAQQLAGSGHSQYMQYLEEMADGQARVAEIMAKTELLKAANPLPGGERIQRSFIFQATTDENGQMKVQRIQNAQALKSNAHLKVFQDKCISCHNPQKSEGNVDLTQFNTFSEDQQRRVVEVITDGDASKRMPLKANGSGGYGPGEPLTLEEVARIIKGTDLQ